MTPDDVPAGPILVDTDVATWLLTGLEPSDRWRSRLQGHVLALSFANVGELLALPIVKNWGERRRAEWTAHVRQSFVVVPFSFAVVQRWAPLHVKLRGHLHAQGTNDLWTAATALTASPALPIAMNNRSDFAAISGVDPLTLIHPDA